MPNGISKKTCALIFIRESRVGTKVGPPLPCLSDGYHVFLGNHDLDDTLIMILTFFSTKLVDKVSAA